MSTEKAFHMRVRPELDAKIEALRGASRRKRAARILHIRPDADFNRWVEDLRVARRPALPRGTLVKALIEEAWEATRGRMPWINGAPLTRSELVRQLVALEHTRVFPPKKRKHK
jgi:hypothetical protein